MTFESLLESFGALFNSFLNALDNGLKLFFNDIPPIFGMRLGWWFILFGILGLLRNYVIGGNEDV